MEPSTKSTLIDFLKEHQKDIQSFHLSKLLYDLTNDYFLENKIAPYIFDLFNEMEEQGKYEPDYWIGVWNDEDFETINYIEIDTPEGCSPQGATKFKNKDYATDQVSKLIKDNEYDTIYWHKWWIIGLKD